MQKINLHPNTHDHIDFFKQNLTTSYNSMVHLLPFILPKNQCNLEAPGVTLHGASYVDTKSGTKCTS
uniref:Putative ovule protein n=1 Tax=Solanum chacoense TaxID=4108 RepID=A0A0V0GFB5_SOLCH